MLVRTRSCLLLVTGSTFSLVRWLEEGSPRWRLLYVGCAVLAVGTHYTFAVTLVWQASYAFIRPRFQPTKATRRAVIWTMALVVVGCSAFAVLLADLWGRRTSLSVGNAATLADLGGAIVPVVPVLGLLLGIGLARTGRRVSFGWPARKRPVVLLMVPWLCIPPTVLFVASVFLDQMLMAPRYYVSAAPAAAGLFGLCLAGVHPAGARRVVAVVVAVVAILASGGPLKNGSDWRGAMSYADARLAADEVVLLHPGFIESRQIDWFSDPTRRSYLLAPASFYPLRGDVIGVPYELDADAEAYMEDLVASQLLEEDRFLLVSSAPTSFVSWLQGRLERLGWRKQTLGSFGIVDVVEFVRDRA